MDQLLVDVGRRPARARCYIEHAAVVPLGGCEVAVVVLLLLYDGWVEQLAGSAVISGDPPPGVVRATLAAVNRRWRHCCPGARRHTGSMKRASLVPEFTVPSPKSLPAWPGREVQLDGLKAYVRDTPATAPGAEPALYVHGLGGSSQNWTDLAGLLADRLDGQAIDLPGFGTATRPAAIRSPRSPSGSSGGSSTADRGPVHLFGNSLGGAIAVRVAGAAPRPGADA